MFCNLVISVNGLINYQDLLGMRYTKYVVFSNFLNLRVCFELKSTKSFVSIVKGEQLFGIMTREVLCF